MNNKNIYKFLSFILCVLIVISSSKINAFSSDYGTVTGTTYATVTRVFDGETFEAQDVTSGEYYLVHMIGVDSKGYDDAYQFTYDRLMGKRVVLSLDENIASPNGRWNYCYVKQGGELINSEIIMLGYGEADISTSDTYTYNDYLDIQESAENADVGMWTDDGIYDSNHSNNSNNYSQYSININTASRSQLVDLEDVSSTLASNIISYRNKNPFNKVSDVKFVDGMTKDIYDENVKYMHVVTNINEAYEYELTTLNGISKSEAKDIIKYREDETGDINIDDLLDEDLLSDDEYDDNKHFITDEDEYRIVYSKGKYSANINTASKKQLTVAGLSSSDAQGIIDILDEGYTIKTIGELQFSDEVTLSEDDLLQLLDNLKVFTDINYSSKSEIESLYGSDYDDYEDVIEDTIDNRYYDDYNELLDSISDSDFNKIDDYIYIDNNDTSYTNINTATYDELLDIGISSSDANAIIKARKNSPIEDYTQMPSSVDITEYNNNISLYTNINNTSINELQSLSEDITQNIAQKIINYTKDQPFGSLKEVYNFFNYINQKDIYYDIKDYIVLY